MKNINIIAARTHTPEYLLHKYWARKPHNVISYFISQLVPNEGLIIDPFCGSGVVLRESQKLNINAIGFDVNPIANLISRVLTNPPDEQRFAIEVDKILARIEQQVTAFYTLPGGTIKYLIHKTVVMCKCETRLTTDEAIKKGRSFYCPTCGAKLRFNLENLVDTKINSIAVENNNYFEATEEQLELQYIFSNKIILNSNFDKYDFRFAENRRILAFSGMRTSSLFTRRNFSILCNIADQIDDIEDEITRDAVKLLLTASVAQCSRLIPARNNLSTGGPAWSVPGFWVPSEHLETNPIVHFRARFTKFLKGIRELKRYTTNADIKIIKSDANNGMEKLISQNKKADLVFFDPPYGDSIPYLEFSAIWNSFLKDFPNPSIDISVSDRLSKADTWDRYFKSIDKTLNNISKILKKNGNLLITFNNNDLKAWEALIGALQRNNFSCNYVTYQIPAVISSKAQFSVAGSYVSDIYSIYSVDMNPQVTFSLEPVVDALIKCAASREGTIAKNLAQRVAMISWMNNNIHVNLLKEKDILIKNLFNEKDGKLTLKNKPSFDCINLADFSRKLAAEILSKGPCDWTFLYQEIAKELIEFGLPDPSELRSYLDGYVLFDKKRCLSIISTESNSDFEQLLLDL